MASFVMLNIISIIIIDNKLLFNCFEVNRIGFETYTAIESSKKNHKNKHTLVLGDSVARQLIYANNIKQNIIDLTSNQVISLAGQYTLLQLTLNSNKQIKTVCLMLIPNALTISFDQIATYDYFIRPFFPQYSEYFNTSTIDMINSKFFSNLYMLPIAKVLPIFGNIRYDDQPRRQGIHLSATTIEYLKLMRNRCQRDNINFKVLAAPVSRSVYKNEFPFNYLQKQINDNELFDILKDYTKSIVPFDDNLFEKDKIHFKYENTKSVSTLAFEQNSFFDVISDNLPDMRTEVPPL